MAMYDPRRKKDREEGPSWKRKKTKTTTTSKPTTAAAQRKLNRTSQSEKIKANTAKRKELLVQREKTLKSASAIDRKRNARRGGGVRNRK